MFSYKNGNSKEYEIYFKVKKYIETIDCNEANLIPRLINGVAAYVPLIIESEDMEPTKYYSLSAAARDCGVSKQTIIYRKMRTVRRKGGFKVFKIEWLD